MPTIHPQHNMDKSKGKLFLIRRLQAGYDCVARITIRSWQSFHNAQTNAGCSFMLLMLDSKGGAYYAMRMPDLPTLFERDGDFEA